METRSNREKGQYTPYTPLPFNIHSSPNNVAGTVLIIILCKEKEKNPRQVFIWEKSMGLSCQASYLVTGVQSREVVKKKKKKRWRTNSMGTC